MDINWKILAFNKDNCKGIIINRGNKLNIVGEISRNYASNSRIMYWGANPVNTNFSLDGSALPFHSPEQAHDKSKNIGVSECKNWKFNFNIFIPNAYYTGLGTIYIAPHIHLKIFDNNKECEYYSIKLSKGNRYRTLHHPPERTSAMFYDNVLTLPHRSQEQILRDSSLNVALKQDTFWGLKPAM